MIDVNLLLRAVQLVQQDLGKVELQSGAFWALTGDVNEWSVKYKLAYIKLREKLMFWKYFVKIFC
jgi:hypothetical protein